ncbi:hypothetical protein D3C81_1608010 [compost metagenome]
MRDIGLEPENIEWRSFGNVFLKELGLAGESLGKLLTGKRDHLNLIIVETETGLEPIVESDKLSGEQLNIAGEELLSEVQSAYLRCVVNETAKRYRQSGLHVEVKEKRTTDGTAFVLSLGSSGKSISITKNANGIIEERVEGIAGRSCTDATALLENLMTNTKASTLERKWTPSYQTTVEDHELKVLKITRG